MKRLFLLFLACSSFSVLEVASAADAPLLSHINDAVALRFNNPAPSKQVETFVLEEMRQWGEHGIVLTKEDLLFAQQGNFRALCSEKKDVNDKEITFVSGGPSEKGSCLGLVSDLTTLLSRERDVLHLADDLLFLSSSDELAIADEAGRPLDIASTSDTLQRIWSGTGGMHSLDLPESATPKIDALESALSAQKDDLLRIVLRYHFGYFRDARERDRRFQDDGASIGDALKELAQALNIEGDQTKKGDRGVHVFSSLGVVLWVRQDDLGLHFITPLAFEYPLLERGGKYPVLNAQHPFVAYPFGYIDTPTDRSLETPLCLRSTGAFGFLCRSSVASLSSCAVPSDRSSVSLIECPQVNPALLSDVCDTDVDFREDTGDVLLDPTTPSRLNPRLPRIAPSSLCTPELSVLYGDSILSHICYTRACLDTSLRDHSLIPGRNPTLVDEMSMPFLACMRDDPRLGLGAEIPTTIVLRLPRYTGYELVKRMEQLYCGMNDSAPNPLLALCSPANDDEKRVQSNQLEYATTLSREFTEGKRNREDIESLASALGKQASAEQSTEVLRTLFLSLAGTLNETASLFQELQNAPLTTTPCPWTGGFSSSSSSGS